MKTKYNNILVIQTAFIGDAILASSVVEKLHAFYPEATISLLVRKGNETLYDAHPFLKETLAWDKVEGKYSELMKLVKIIRANKYDAVINLHRYSSSGFLTAFSGAKYKAGFDTGIFASFFTKKVKHIIGNGRHEIERYNQLIETITDKNVAKPKLYPSASDFEKVKLFVTGKYVCISPSSVWRTKQLPEQKWVALCNSIPEDTTIFILGHKSDMGLCNSLKAKLSRQNTKTVAGELTLLQSAALIKGAEMSYVNDSGPLHLASAMNANVTAFFLSTIPAFGFGPLSDNSKIVEVNNLECRPCGIHGYKNCPKVHFKCGFDIDISKVFNPVP